MLIKVHSMNGFFENLRGSDGLVLDIFEKTIFYEDIRTSLTQDHPRNSHAVQVDVSFSAIINYPSGAQAMVLADIYCGVDRTIDDGDLEGQMNFIKYLDEVTEFGTNYGIQLKPGILHT